MYNFMAVNRTQITLGKLNTKYNNVFLNCGIPNVDCDVRKYSVVLFPSCDKCS